MLIRVLIVLLCAASVASAAVSDQLVEKYAGALRDGTFAFGPPATDRAAWEKLSAEPFVKSARSAARSAATRPIGDLPDALYLEFTRTGNRSDYEHAYFDRTLRLNPLVIAECAEHKGRYVPAIEKLIAAICSQRTWLLPSADGQLKNFNGKEIDIDLDSSNVAAQFAYADYLLGDELSAATRQLIAENVRRRVLQPFLDMINGKRAMNWWMTADDNWNAVCLANTLEAGMAMLPDQMDRARFAAAAEEYSAHYLAGFTPDGYCTEGLGYWDFGFGHYVMLSELIWQATDGKVDLLSGDLQRAIAEFPSRFEIVDGIYPDYADAHFGVKPDAALEDFLSRRFGLATVTGKIDLNGDLRATMMYACANSASTGKTLPAGPLPLVGWFPDGQVLACRPGDSGSRMAVSIKGGRNGVNHGHDDLGSFIVVVGKETVLVDPGGEIYTARTFSKDRFKSTVINSFGHSVPVVAGQLQRHTAGSKTTVLNTAFSDSEDVLELDLTAAYGVPELKKLTRTFTYDRGGGGMLTVKDEVAYNNPESFGITFITFGTWKQTGPDSLVVQSGKESVQIAIDSGGVPLVMSSQEIKEDLPKTNPGTPTHIEVDLGTAVEHATLTARISRVP